MTDRAFGIPRSRGPLRMYRSCEYCEGHGYDPLYELPCIPCGATGRILVDEMPQTTAAKRAAETVRKTQGKGKLGRNM